MDPAALGAQEHALDVAWNAQAAQVFRAIEVLRFEGLGCQAEVRGDAVVVGLGQVNEPRLITAVDTPALTFESLRNTVSII